MSEPTVAGVGRNAEWPKSLIVYFSRPLTDDEMRSFHDQIRDWTPMEPGRFEDKSS